MKLSVENILSKLRIDPNYFRYIRKELKEDADFAKLVVLIDPYLYFKFSHFIQRNYEVVQVILDSASIANLDFPYGKLYVQDEKQKKQLMKIIKINSYILLYKNISNNEFVTEVLNINNFDLYSNVFLGIDKAFDSLTINETDVIKLRYGICDGNPKNTCEIAALMCSTREIIRKTEARGIRKLRNFLKSDKSKQYKLK